MMQERTRSVKKIDSSSNVVMYVDSERAEEEEKKNKKTKTKQQSDEDEIKESSAAK